MDRKEIPFNEFNINIIKAFDNDWFLLTAGGSQPGNFNSMTVSWGSIGVMWGRPMVQVVVRPTRYTYGFIENADTFTISLFPSGYKDVLGMLGSKSGRDMDKIKESGLTPAPSSKVDAPGFDEAELIIECRKNYHDQFKPAGFLADYIAPGYTDDFHHIYYGEILSIWGIDKYRAVK